MKNRKALDRFEQASNAKIEKLFWIAGSLENSDLHSLLDDLDDDQWEKLFPEIYNSKFFEANKNSADNFGLVDFLKFGFIAEVTIPLCDNFRYGKNKTTPESWSTGYVSHICYVYAETPEQLLKLIEAEAKFWFKEDIKNFKSKGGK